MTSSSINVIVTGASRGLGYELVKQLGEHPPIQPLLILACARKPPENDNLRTKAHVRIQWFPLDVTDSQSVANFATLTKQQCPEGIDVLINNAGVNLEVTNQYSIETANQTIATNHDGTLRMTQSFLPLMRCPAHEQLRRSRIVNISSIGSKLSAIPSASLRKTIRGAASLEEISILRHHYLSSVSQNTEVQNGWPKGSSYSVSKALINATTQVLAAQHPLVIINACCPGWCQTDMGNLVGPPSKSTADGAKIPLKLAFGDIDESGKYWENASVHDNGDGEIAEWYVKGGS